MNYTDAYQKWLDDPSIAEEDKEELRGLSDQKEIEDRFYRELEFGTAGMRGVIGMGTNRMNKYVVAKATQGYADYLAQIPGASERGVTIAYDSRRMSEDFALEAALVLCGNGIKVNLFDTIHSVPQLSFALQYYGSIGGIVITASHNPKQYNGYKLYGENGAQIPPSIADKVTAAIEAVPSLASIKRMTRSTAVAAGYLTMIGSGVDRAYFSYTESLSLDRATLRKAADFKVIYTPLNGTGGVPVPKLLADIGIKNVFVVPEQKDPDPEFSTVSAPNPEAPDAFHLAIRLADEKGADLILATDPDADRLGVAVREKNGTFAVLTGNQIGCLLLHYILMCRKNSGTLPKDAFVVKSIVSTNMANAIARDFGVRIDEVLTGFRFIGEKIAESAQSGQGSFLFGFEESYGFLAGTKVRDKDAICGAMLISEVAAYYATRGMTLKEGLVELFDKYGYYTEVVRNYTLYGKEGLEKIQGAMKGLREELPAEFAGYRVTAVRDYLESTRTVHSIGEPLPIDLPPSNVLYFELEDGSWVCARPSGTEPKLKVYANGYARAFDSAKLKLDAMIDSMEALLAKWLD